MKTTLSILIILSIGFFKIAAQTPLRTRPKVGLCLSGGAAKGIAHIALLKAIDSLGIKVDFITGTSMGSVIGGMYAIGYSGKDLDSIVRTINWDEILTNNVSLADINMDEKDEYGRYSIELPFVKGRFRLPFALIEGQALTNFLEKYAFRALAVNDFKHLPIPFKCMTADVVKGDAITLDSGNLAMAMRMSMAIPTVFMPIEKGELLLVDGGLVKNFPVDQVCEMGADVIIGSYTGGILYDKKRLNNFVKIMYQSASYSRMADAEEQKKRCDILMDFDPALRVINAEASDFRKTKAILRASDKAVLSILPQLKKIAAAQKNAQNTEGVLPNISLPQTDSVRASSIEIVEYFPETDESRFLEAEYFSADHKVSQREIKEKEAFLYGTRHYNRIYHTIEYRNNQPVLKISVVSAPGLVLKIGLHFDSELGTGITANATFRNVLGNFSRAIVSADISDKPKFRVDYRKRLGASRFWANGGIYFENVSSDLFVQGRNLDNYQRQLFNAQMSINFLKTSKNNLSAGLFFENVKYRPQVLATDKLFLTTGIDTVLQLSLYRYTLAGLQAQYSRSTLDNRVFPHRGSSFTVSARLPLSTKRILEQTAVVDTQIVSTILSEVDVKNAYYTVLGDFQKVFHVNNNVQILLNAAGGLYSNTNEKEIAVEEPALKFALGGVEGRGSYQFVPYWGNREGFNAYSSFFTSRLAVQMHIIQRFYVIPAFSILVGDAFVTNRSSQGLNKTYSSWGVILGIKTPIGPIQFNVSKANNDPQWRTYFSLGTRF